MPLLIAVPFLFVIGVLFGYFVVLPAAVRFFVNFNSAQFNSLVQASQYYRFAATILLAMGIIFQVPVVIFGRHAPGDRHAGAAAQEPPLRDRRLRQRRGVPARRRDHAAAGDGSAVSPLRGEYSHGSHSRAFDATESRKGRERRKELVKARVSGTPADDPEPRADHTEDPTVQQIIDHVDDELSTDALRSERPPPAAAGPRHLHRPGAC